MSRQLVELLIPFIPTVPLLIRSLAVALMVAFLSLSPTMADAETTLDVLVFDPESGPVKDMHVELRRAGAPSTEPSVSEGRTAANGRVILKVPEDGTYALIVQEPPRILNYKHLTYATSRVFERRMSLTGNKPIKTMVTTRQFQAAPYDSSASCTARLTRSEIIEVRDALQDRRGNLLTSVQPGFRDFVGNRIANLFNSLPGPMAAQLRERLSAAENDEERAKISAAFVSEIEEIKEGAEKKGLPVRITEEDIINLENIADILEAPVVFNQWVEELDAKLRLVMSC